MENYDEVFKYNENKNHGEAEAERVKKGAYWAFGAIIVVCVLMLLFEYFTKRSVDFGKPFLVFMAAAILDLYTWKDDPKGKGTLVRGIIGVVLAVLFLLFYIVRG